MKLVRSVCAEYFFGKRVYSLKHIFFSFQSFVCGIRSYLDSVALLRIRFEM